MSNVQVVSQTQRIIVNPANSSVSVINAGPMGPSGPTGPSEAAAVLTVNGQLLTRAAGVLAAITRANLAADTAFSALYQPLDADLAAIAALTTTSYGRAFLALANQAALVALLPSYQPLDSDLTSIAAVSTASYGRSLLALANGAALADETALKAALDARYASETSGSGAPGGTGTNGQWYYDTTNDRLYVSDGVGWIIMFEPEQTYTPTLVNVTLGSPGQTNTGFFTRQAGFCDFRTRAVLGTGGSVGGGVTVQLPKATGVTPRGTHRVHAFISGVADYEGRTLGEAAAATVTSPCIDNAAGTYTALAAITTGVPATWAVNCVLEIIGRFKMNTLYL